ncbi:MULTISPECIES: FGGY-family carbohydrate kinase [Microbacterium]|uniref:FGGY-family carbohydrate kinase n=1 Tax=Microbacterium TaxID=33882 RepID=UPI003F9B8775
MTDPDALLIGIDVGTTGVKVVLLDPEAGILAQANRSNALLSAAPGWAEADPRQWSTNIDAALSEIADAAAGRKIGAISTTGMVPAIVAVDARLQPVRPAILQNDARARGETDGLASQLDPVELLAVTGAVLSQQSVAPKARWLAHWEPDAWRRTRWILGSSDWVLTALGAAPHVEANWALESGIFRIDGAIHARVADLVDGLADRLPPVRSAGDVVGVLDADAAVRTGLAPGIPLVVGGADHALSAYSAGLGHPGDWLVKLGGAGDILAVTDGPLTDARFFLDKHPLPGLWLPNGCMATSGSLVRWVQALLRIDDLAAMDEAASERTAADVLCLPYFLGEKSPLNDPDLRGVFAGMHLGHDAVDLYRSALEGIAFGFRHNADVLAEAGAVLDCATVTNGGATSLLWKRIHASILGVPLETVRDHPGASLGAAYAAGVGVGAFADWREPLALTRKGETIDPEPDLVARYDDAYAIWRDFSDVAASPMRALARR